jgi:hypothetical protein
VLRERCPVSKLTLSVTPCHNPKLAERQHLQAYVAEFGEAPPLNVRER